MKIVYENLKTGEEDKERTRILLPTQERFFKCTSRFPLYSGGYGSGKSDALCLKVIQHLSYPDNYGLLGRLHYQELKDSTEQTFFKFLPSNYIAKYNRSEGRLFLRNGSQLVFRHLDTVAEGEIKSMNLGFFAIDQVEEVPESVFLGLKGRLRRKVTTPKGFPKYKHQGMMVSNPALFWAYKYYKQKTEEERIKGGFELFEASTLENKDNLPPEYIEDLLNHDEKWKRQYVYGIWDLTLLSDNAYFPVEYIDEQMLYAKKPLRSFEHFTIYHEKEMNDEYQVGVDPSEGSSEDFSAITVISKRTGEVVAVWKGKIPADLLAEKIKFIARIYRNALVVLECNAIGLATLTKLKEDYSNIYKREVFDTISKKKIQKYGWKTSHSNKVLLLDNFLKLLRENKIRLNDPQIIAEMKSFIWTDESKKSGMGATPGFHDDLIISTSLAYWGIKGDYQQAPIQEGDIPKGSVLGTLEEIKRLNKRYIGH